jgi:hypothetical protein
MKPAVGTTEFIGVDKMTAEAVVRDMRKHGWPMRQIAVNEYVWNGEAWAMGKRVFGGAKENAIDGR